MKKIDEIKSVKLLSNEELLKFNGGGPGDAAYAVGYGAVIGEVMLFGGLIPAGYLTYKFLKRALK
ncbi:hypothetical protein [Pedobacter sp.]